MSPNLNAYAERFVRSIKEECLDRIILVRQASLRRAVSEYMKHYHPERPTRVSKIDWSTCQRSALKLMALSIATHGSAGRSTSTIA